MNANLSRYQQKKRAGQAMRTLFGRETSYVAGLYFRRALIFSGIVLAIILALDVVGRMTRVLSLNDDAGGLDGLWVLLHYVLLRAAFVLPQLLPVAAIMGVLWAEFALSKSNERSMIFSSGRAPINSVMPALIFGVVIGALQFGAVNIARPYSAQAQAEAGYRNYGVGFSRAETVASEWFATEGTVFNARVAFDPRPVLKEVVVYRIAPTGRLEAIITADEAAALPAGEGWEFQNGKLWSFSWADDGWSWLERADESFFSSIAEQVPLDPVWTDHIGIDPHLLPFTPLKQLATADGGIPDALSFKAAYQQRYADVLICIAMALVGAGLALTMFKPKTAPMRLLAVAAIGYGVHVGTTTLTLFGESGLVLLFVSVWIWPLFLSFGTLLFLYGYDQRVQDEINRNNHGSRAG
ncbi:MAG: LptF/LptG family permease [Cognatishimia sp.]|uniref:LptF/LptG family permease n=1 Tax=Cognatishimia sp. TaxID=2211648 RepID=UPI003B8DE5AD